MRPVDKGPSPYERIAKYQDAEQYLENRLGAYCSFCEMRVNNALAVEHKESKNSGGALTDWKNLLLACTYCNSRKLEKIKKGEANKWIWPDQHNTFLAFTYKDAVPKVNEQYLQTISDEVLQKAKALFQGLALDYHPNSEGNVEGKEKYRDKRWNKRFEALTVAEEARCSWEKHKNTNFRDDQLTNIVNQARGYGFFSIWMMVFEGEIEVRNALISAFPGTDRSSFDKSALPLQRKGSEL